jgi:transposase
MDALAAGHDAAVQMIDTSVVRVHQHGACISDNNHQDMGRSRGGLSCKIHAVVDSNGLPVHLALTPGEAHDNRLCSVLLSALLPQTMLLADRGYDADWIRELARQQAAWANIPPKRNRKDPTCFSPYLYRARNLIERFFHKIKRSANQADGADGANSIADRHGNPPDARSHRATDRCDAITARNRTAKTAANPTEHRPTRN